MKILLVYPPHPDTFWSFKHALKFIFKRASHPPLGLLTVAAMLPQEWEKKLVDMNVHPLLDKQLQWADLVFISAMSVQKPGVQEVITRCQKAGVKMVAGGPLFTAAAGEFPEIDHLVLNEAEVTLAPFLRDLQNGQAQRIYTSEQRADLTTTPLPMWSLINIKHYGSMSVQYSRGCPFECEFCDIARLYGQKTRTKEAGQIVAELDALYARGWRGTVFMVDDNFIGNKAKLKNSILPALSEWMQRKKHPFSFYTQCSINLADDAELTAKMVDVGFDRVFVGIETPNESSLAECSKFQNKGRDLVTSVKTLQQAGLQVQGGFIIGFDNDPVSIFDTQVNFIQKSGIVTAMVGLLNAMQGTPLHRRLEKENRLLIGDAVGNNTDGTINFIPRMNLQTLMDGYKRVVQQVYSPKYYYKRVRTFLRDYRPAVRKKSFRLEFSTLAAFFRSMVSLGIIGKERLQYWKLFFWSLFRRPRSFPLAITLAIYGFHYRKSYEKSLGY